MKPSIDDVARKAGVSKSTVSRAFSRPDLVSEATRAKVLDAADSLNFSVSRASGILKSGRLQRIALLVGSREIDWFSARIIEGLNTVFQEAGYDLVIYPIEGIDGRATFFRELPVRGNADAVVISSFDIKREEIQRLHTAHIPLVGINVADPNGFDASVSIDDAAGMRLAVRHLARLGHHEIVYVQPQAISNLRFSSFSRVTGFTTSCEEEGLSGQVVVASAGNATFDATISAVLASETPPTALCFHQDSMAIPFFFRLRQIGMRIPEELSVIGFDDSDFAAEVGLTTIRQRPLDMALAAAHDTLSLIDGQALDAPHRIESPQLIVRASTAAPKPSDPA